MQFLPDDCLPSQIYEVPTNLSIGDVLKFKQSLCKPNTQRGRQTPSLPNPAWSLPWPELQACRHSGRCPQGFPRLLRLFSQVEMLSVSPSIAVASLFGGVCGLVASAKAAQGPEQLWGKLKTRINNLLWVMIFSVFQLMQCQAPRQGCECQH